MNRFNISKFLFFAVLLSFCSSCNVLFNNRRLAYKQIGEMKEQPVLVRIKIATQEQRANKSEIIRAFNEGFEFTEYYFFDSTEDNYNAIKNKEFDKVVLTSKDGNELRGPKFLNDGFFVITLDGAYETHYASTDADGNKHPSGGTGKKPGAAVLGEDFMQLVLPFPYRSKWVPNMDHKDYDYMVQNLNMKLSRFYELNYAKVRKFKDFKPTRSSY